MKNVFKFVLLALFLAACGGYDDSESIKPTDDSGELGSAQEALSSKGSTGAWNLALGTTRFSSMAIVGCQCHTNGSNETCMAPRSKVLSYRFTNNAASLALATPMALVDPAVEFNTGGVLSPNPVGTASTIKFTSGAIAGSNIADSRTMFQVKWCLTGCTFLTETPVNYNAAWERPEAETEIVIDDARISTGCGGTGGGQNGCYQRVLRHVMAGATYSMMGIGLSTSSSLLNNFATGRRTNSGVEKTDLPTWQQCLAASLGDVSLGQNRWSISGSCGAPLVGYTL